LATVHKGRYSLRGRNSLTTVRGPAKWETIEASGGTRTVVKQGKVSVRDLHRHKSVLVWARHSYLAKPHRTRAKPTPPRGLQRGN
jgi:hypothetical protein